MTFNMPEKLKKIMGKLLSKDKLLLVLLFGVLLIVINIPAKKSQSSDKDSTKSDSQTVYKTDSTDEYTTRLEAALEKTLSASSEIGKTSVIINVKDSGKKILYTQKRTSESEVEESVVYSKLDGDEIPYVINEEMPEIQGVIICAQGAGSASVISQVTQAASAFLGVSVNKIKVLKLEV